MTKDELLSFVQVFARDGIDKLKQGIVVAEGRATEAIEIALISEARIAALEDALDKAMKEIGALQSSTNASLFATAPPHSHQAPLPARSSSYKPNSRASSISRHDSVNSIYGAEDHYPNVSDSPSPNIDAPEVPSPQLDRETEDELAALEGWVSDQGASNDDSDDSSITDQDAEGETEDGYEAPVSATLNAATHAPAAPVPVVVVQALGQVPARMPFRPLSECRARRAGRPWPK